MPATQTIIYIFVISRTKFFHYFTIEIDIIFVKQNKCIENEFMYAQELRMDLIITNLRAFSDVVIMK